MNWFKKRKRRKEIRNRMDTISKEFDEISWYLFNNPNIDFGLYNKMREPLFDEWFELQKELKSL